MKPTIITVSGKARHGKDTFCDMLKDKLEQAGKRVLRIGYADYMKFIAQKHLGWNGIKDDAGRTLLQQLGTEKVRANYPSFWVDTVIRLVEILADDYDYIIISDCRYPNEIELWAENGYRCISIHIERTGFESVLTDEQKQHLSEIALDGYIFDYFVEAENIEELAWEVGLFVKELV